jgi:hypothetical protein
MNKEDQKKFVIGFLAILIIINLMQLAWIAINRFLFWFDAFVIITFPIILVIFIIMFLKTNEWERRDLYIFSIIYILLFLFAITNIGDAYNKGYSDKAIKHKANLEGNLEEYAFILSISTGQFKMELEGEIIGEVNKALCDSAPETPCEEVIKNYETYQNLVGWKEFADNITKIWEK